MGWSGCTMPSDRLEDRCDPAAEEPMLSTVLDRELDEEKSFALSGPRIRCPLCGWSLRKDERWACSCGLLWNTFDTGEFAPPVFTSGLRPSASRASGGRGTPMGMRPDKYQRSRVTSPYNPNDQDYAADGKATLGPLKRP